MAEMSKKEDQFAVSQAEQSAKATILENQLDIKVRARLWLEFLSVYGSITPTSELLISNLPEPIPRWRL